jgi:hypothetical protein
MGAFRHARPPGPSGPVGETFRGYLAFDLPLVGWLWAGSGRTSWSVRGPRRGCASAADQAVGWL